MLQVSCGCGHSGKVVNKAVTVSPNYPHFLKGNLRVIFIIIFLISSCGPSSKQIQGTAQAEIAKIEMVLVPEGEFIMGNEIQPAQTGFAQAYPVEKYEQPVHTVFLDTYYIDKYEVTNARYKLCVDAGQCRSPYSHKFYDNPQYSQHPVEFISWKMAKLFCEWRGARLPTEAEWEKAASWDEENRIKRIYPWGDSIDCSFANYDRICIGETTKVGSYPTGASPYGALDMAGNVWEWVADAYIWNYYAMYPVDQWPPNPTGPEYIDFEDREEDSIDGRVARGGNYKNSDYRVRTTFRFRFDKDHAGEGIGFRCAMSTIP
jgi:serine/threonine-protein kinase